MTRSILAVFALATALGCWAVGTLLSRIDAVQLTAHQARSEAAAARIELLTHRHVEAETVDAVCRRNTVALRGAILALVRTGTVSMPNDPGGEWVTWRAEERP